ncbi:MerR family DNA-binding transcriptional regulator [Rhodococcus sp. ACT016]|uniref:helix-turn-helix domain-containing protein n=1 Tax=Rhodococcus sp. ACT016 TaxID=3134808 RepID=UPI003D268810
MTEQAVQIGDAAALFDVTPATLRWWEELGVLEAADRVGGRRVYASRDLRRIGLAYMCCVIGMMPLDEAAAVTSGNGSRSEWREALRRNIDRLDQRTKRLDAARRYLTHLLHCEEDDIGANCPILDSELVARTPRGRVPVDDLLEAAHLAQRRSTGRRRDDETERDSSRGDETSAGLAYSRCASCPRLIAQPAQGRRRKYCSHTCRQRAYRIRKAVDNIG